ncbi:MAG: Ig-like domain-containing protein [Rubripirellula sp.]
MRTELDETTVQTSPRGSGFTTDVLTVQTSIGQFTNVQDVVTTDINGDSFPDLILSLFEGNEISIRLNQGDGTFSETPISVSVSPLGTGPISIAVADLNGQGSVDLIVANNLSSNAAVLLDFNGSGFESTTFYAVGDTPQDVATGDFDGQNGVDFAVVNSQTNTIGILLNDGSGNFGAVTSINTNGASPTSITSGDFNNDNIVDLAVTNLGTGTSGNVAVFFNGGSANFTLDQTYAVGNGPISIVAEDLNGDGQDDLAVANFLSNTASLLRGSVSGTFTVLPDALAVGQGPIQIGTADIENDGDTDLLVTNLLSQQVSILRSSPDRGDLVFEPAESFGVAEAEVAEQISFSSDDLNGDGTTDLVIANSFTDSVRVLKNNLVDGAHRISISGATAVTELNFGTKPSTLPPSLDPISDPSPIVEDALTQTVTLTGLAKGRPSGPALQITATSSNTASIPNPTVAHTDGSSTATLQYTPVANAVSPATITVTVTDAGADQTFNTIDDVSIVGSFLVNILPVNDAPTFQLPASTSVNEDATAQTIANFVTGISSGGGSDEAGQTRNPFAVTTDNSFFATPPAISATGQLTYTPAANAAGSVTVNVSLSDNGGSANGGISQTSAAFVINITPVNDPPSITIGGNQSAQENSGAATVAGFANGFAPGGGADEATQTINDFVVTNNNNSLFAVQPQIASNGTLTYTPAAVASGTATVSVQVRDSGGVETSAVQTFNITITSIPDTTGPSTVISTNQPNLTSETSFNVSVDFGETVSGFAAADVTATGATVGTIVDQGNGLFTVPITASADGAVTIAVGANVANDGAGNGNAAATPLTLTVDSTALVPTVTTAASSPTTSNSFDVAIDFGETVTGFVLADLTLIGATSSNLVDNGGGQYSVTLTASGDGQVILIVPAGAAKDAAGNDSLKSSTLSVTVDSTSPAPVITSTVGSLTNLSTFDVTVDFGEAVTGFEATDLNASGASAGTPVDLGNGRFSVPITKTNNGTATISMGASVVTDLAGNGNTSATPVSVTVDSTALIPTLSTSQASPTTDSAFDVSIDFGETVTGFSADRVTVINGSVSNLVDNGNGAFTASVTATADGQVTLIVPAAAAQDSANNSSLTSAQLNVVVDTAAPAPAFSVLDSSPGNQTTRNVEVDFGEPVSGFEASDLVLSSGSTENISDRGDGRFIATLTGLAEGAFTLSLAADVVTDAAGNANLAAADLTQTVTLPTAQAIVLEGSGNTFFLTQSNSQLDGVQLIDIRGTGDNTLMLDVDRIREVFASGAISVLSDAGDTVVFDDGWEFVEAVLANGQLVRRFEQLGASISLTGPDDFTNPLSEFDVNASGDISSLDALQIINELSRRAFSDGQANPEGGVRDVTTIDLDLFRFYDVTRDLRITALDALRVINQLGRQPSGEQIEGELIAPLQATLSETAERDLEQSPVALDATQAVQAPLDWSVSDSNTEATSIEIEASSGQEAESWTSELIDEAMKDAFLTDGF